MILPPRLRSRRQFEAELATKAARRRSAPHTEPSLFELVVGIAAFVAVAATCLYLVAWLGR